MFTPTCPLGNLTVNGVAYQRVDLPALAGERLSTLPVVLRLLLENVARCMRPGEREAALHALLAWPDQGHSDAEIEFQPARVLMHDTTSTPALVDLAALRDALREAGCDPKVLNPTLPVDVSVDHSLSVHVHAQAGAADANLKREMQINAERYRFLRWASQAFEGVQIHPPGTGIMHTLNLEQLATVVREVPTEGAPLLIPDTLIGTDSHTPMINALGVLGWGVGGLEAQTVMLGMPTLLRIPEVLGIRLTGQLPAGVTATDLGLRVTQAIRQLAPGDCFVEFFGPGVSTLTVGQRGVLANLAPEYGVTTACFAVDDQTLAHLRAMGRSEAEVARVAAYAQAQGLWFDPSASPRYTQVLTLDLSQVQATISGPTRPQDARPLSDLRQALLNHRGLSALPAATPSGLPPFALALAAITSCTNTSDPALLMAAGLLARKARARGVRPPAWVKTSLSPGSPAAALYLRRAGVLDDLEALGFHVVGHGCATCIGNSGPLLPAITQAQANEGLSAVAVISGNRNFPGRIHPDLDLAFLMSPALVVALALAGHAGLDPLHEPLTTDAQGQPVHLHELWPTDAEVHAAVQQGVRAQDFAGAFQQAARNPEWQALPVPRGDCFAWDPRSTNLQRPPFASAEQGSLLGHWKAYPLLVLGDDVTTDHISPASAIPPHSQVADFLVAKGESRETLNVFASRRGNWEVMVRAAFHSKTLVNLLCPTAPIAHTVHQPSGEVLPLWEVAQRYAQAGQATVLVAGERYGMGSSRDWAAKGLRLLGVHAVLAQSFERIHRSNLIGMGILPLVLPPEATPAALALTLGDQVEVVAPASDLHPGAAVSVRIHRAQGEVQTWTARAALQTQGELALLRAGGVMPHILRQQLSRPTKAA